MLYVMRSTSLRRVSTACRLTSTCCRTAQFRSILVVRVSRSIRSCSVRQSRSFSLTHWPEVFSESPFTASITWSLWLVRSVSTSAFRSKRSIRVARVGPSISSLCTRTFSSRMPSASSTFISSRVASILFPMSTIMPVCMSWACFRFCSLSLTCLFSPSHRSSQIWRTYSRATFWTSIISRMTEFRTSPTTLSLCLARSS
mmetsp:Transcript_56923/g.101616  ORF Transcript_56923/g.101616 Transcript_56923/m.101616 type:complete len:200 (+) Transcript_56923:2015-2614(+)